MLQALQNFKLRALALLEIFAKATPGSPLLASSLAQLVEATESAEKTSRLQPVAERLRAVICKICRFCQSPLQLWNLVDRQSSNKQ